MPVANGFFGWFVGIDSGQLRKRNGHLPSLPADLHQHVVLAGIFRGHAYDLDRLTFPQR